MNYNSINQLVEKTGLFIKERETETGYTDDTTSLLYDLKECLVEAEADKDRIRQERNGYQESLREIRKLIADFRDNKVTSTALLMRTGHILDRTLKNSTKEQN